MINLGLKAAMIGALAATGVLMTQANQPAHADWDICKNVRIKVVNKTNKAIKLVDLDYIDMRIDRCRAVVAIGRNIRIPRIVGAAVNHALTDAVHFERGQIGQTWHGF